jgi:DMSO reductase anchor subunit
LLAKLAEISYASARLRRAALAKEAAFGAVFGAARGLAPKVGAKMGSKLKKPTRIIGAGLGTLGTVAEAQSNYAGFKPAMHTAKLGL